MNKFTTTLAAMGIALTTAFSASAHAPNEAQDNRTHASHTVQASLPHYNMRQAQAASTGQFLIHLGTENLDETLVVQFAHEIESRTGFNVAIATGDLPISMFYINGAPGRPLTPDSMKKFADDIESYAEKFGLISQDAPSPALS